MANKSLTIALLKDEIRKMMTRVAKCDKRIEAGITGVVNPEGPGETEQARKERLMGAVGKRLAQIKEIEEAK